MSSFYKTLRPGDTNRHSIATESEPTDILLTPCPCPFTFVYLMVDILRISESTLKLASTFRAAAFSQNHRLPYPSIGTDC
ncbi:hypothetical protein ASPCADRAFT_166094 [Aspergillus carbonarius ITEM 5010]|uniref:Uncharacterized protein n=1 Tax=Aspergillus carbonarius (strain ITEM 5010) TaxID=602072 RepID=A0A1R3RSA6_ASPC5|nr:hypothetical protein ASPCADRAFT_166094 [Aspergillus carbonarius ITEM 5010]